MTDGSLNMFNLQCILQIIVSVKQEMAERQAKIDKLIQNSKDGQANEKRSREKSNQGRFGDFMA